MKSRSSRLTRNLVITLALPALLSLPFVANASMRTSLPSAATGVDRSSGLIGAGDWPMYGRDFQRTNYNPDETTINAGNVAQLVQRWQANIGFSGSATSAAPSIANGVVYAGSSAASPANNFFAFDAITGSSVFSEAIGYRNPGCFNVGIGSTPAISGTQVVIGADNASSNPSYYGFSTSNGSQVWDNPMGVGASGFPWASAFLYNGRAYIGIASRCDNPSVRGELRAIDMTDGSTVGSAFIVGPGERGGGIWNSPALSVDGTIIAIGTGEDYSCTDCSLTRSMVTVDADTLAVLQHHQEPSPNQDLDFGTTPVIFHDNLGRDLVGAGHKNNTFYVYDLSDVNSGAIWTRSTGGVAVGLMPAYDPDYGSGGTLFIVNSSITAVDPANGGVRWGPVSIGTSHGNIAIANGLIFVNRGSSGLDIRSESDGSLLRNLPPPNAGSANSGVAVSHGFIYWLSGSYLNAWSLPAGTPSTTPTAGSPTATNTPTNTPTHTSTSTNTPTPLPPTGTSTPSATNTTGPTSTSTDTPLPTNSPTNSPTATNTATTAPTQTPGGPTATPVPTDTATNTPAPPTDTPVGASATPTSPPASTATSTRPPTATAPPPATATPTTCVIEFTDVPPGSTFYAYIECLACRGIINGYTSGCETGNPCFRPGDLVTRGQLAKIVSNSAGFNEDPGPQRFQDVPLGSTFFDFIGRLASRDIISGYPCGGPGEPCVGPYNLPYFRPNANVTRGQMSKIVAEAAGYSEIAGPQQFQDVVPGSTFYDYIWRLTDRGIISGYPCGGVGEPCVDPGDLPYFRPGANATRGQASKIVSNTFFPECLPTIR